MLRRGSDVQRAARAITRNLYVGRKRPWKCAASASSNPPPCFRWTVGGGDGALQRSTASRGVCVCDAPLGPIVEQPLVVGRFVCRACVDSCAVFGKQRHCHRLFDFRTLDHDMRARTSARRRYGDAHHASTIPHLPTCRVCRAQAGTQRRCGNVRRRAATTRLNVV